MVLLIAPRPTANKIPPARQRITLTNVEPIGVIIDTPAEPSYSYDRPHTLSESFLKDF